MGGRNSKRSVDITASPPKEATEENGAVATEEGAGAACKLEKATENVENVKATLNGDATHTKAQSLPPATPTPPQCTVPYCSLCLEAKVLGKDYIAHDETPTQNGTESPAKTTEPETPVKAEEATPETVTTPEKAEEVTSPVTSPDEKTADEGEKTSEKPEKKEKKKNKIIKTLRSLSFSRKAKPDKTPVTSPTSKEESEKTEENAETPAKTEELASPLTSVIEEAGAAAATAVTKVEETLTEVKNEVVTVCEKVTKEVSEKVEAVVEKVEAVVEKKSEPEKVPEVKTETAPASAPAEEVPPPLPASPPPTEIPSPTPVAPSETIKNVVNEHQQQDNEEMNGGGESLAELTPEENGEKPLLNGDHDHSGTNGFDSDKEIKAPTSDKVEEELSSKVESLKLANSEDLPEISSNEAQASSKNEKKKKKGGKKKNAEKKSQGQTAK
nr:PREDICTED: muscle M-line assembly protein unc-89-like isoform X2 [Bemisia tabaci]